MKWDDLVSTSGSVGAEDIRDALRTLPANVYHFLKSKVIPELNKGKKIQAIKELRNTYYTSLKAAKDIVDIIQLEPELLSQPSTDPSAPAVQEVLVNLGVMDDSCRKALQAVLCNEHQFDDPDRNTLRVSLGNMRTQLASLWDTLSGAYKDGFGGKDGEN